jgi:hypothetical protein
MQTMEMSVPRPDKSLSFDRRKVEFPRLAGLKLNPRNAKVHPDAQIGQIARSIERFGFNNPILIDSQNNVLAGEGRLRAARLLGLERVAAREIEGVVEEAVREKLDIADASGQAITDRIERIVLSDTQIRVTLNARGRASPAATVKIPWTPNKTSYDCVPTHSEHKPDPKLVQAIVRAHAWLADLKNGRF